MSVEVLLLGYPSRVRFADWQAANSLPEGELPRLSAEQQKAAQKLMLDERGYQVAIETWRRAREHVKEKIDRVAGVISAALKQHDPADRLERLVWDFRRDTFEFSTRWNGRETIHGLPTPVVDSVVRGEEGAAERLRFAVESELRLLVG